MDLAKLLRLQWDRFSAWLCAAGGFVALIIGWEGVSGTAYPAEQLPYIISGGLGGLFLLGLAGMLWLSADLRDEWSKLDRIEQALREGSAEQEPPVPAASATKRGSRTSSRRVASSSADGAVRQDRRALGADRKRDAVSLTVQQKAVKPGSDGGVRGPTI